MTGGDRRGELRVLLGAAPGVGKTYAMLNEGRRRAARGTDVVVGFVETHGRARTAEQVAGLEVIARRTVAHRGAEFTEMDVDAILAREPQVVLVDELAHTNVPGSRHARRCADVEELLAAGIDVITTVNVQHLESLNDVVESITGIRQNETVPDAVVRAADQIELVDMAPEALRRRMAHGNVYPAERVDAALHNYFRPGNLAALRELALLWVADRVDAGLARYRTEHRIDAPWPTRDRVVVALSGGPEGAALIRRGARTAGKGVGGELHAVYVARSDGLAHRDSRALHDQRALVEDLAGTFHTLTGDDPAEAVLEYARSVNATSIVVGQSRRRSWQRLVRTPVSARIVGGSGDIDCQIVTHDWVGSGANPTPRQLSLRRRLIGAVLAVVLPVLLTAFFAASPALQGHQVSLVSFLAATVLVALVGGLVPAIVAALLSSMLINFFFTDPRYTLTIADPLNVAGLIIFVVVAVAVSLVVGGAARRARQAAEARAEADTLLALTTDTLRPEASVSSVLARIQETFRQRVVLLRHRDSDTAPWVVEARAGGTAEGAPDTELALDDRRSFALHGRGLTPAEQRVLTAFGNQVMAQLERHDLAAEAGQARELAARNAFQTSLLAAVSHDLRTPLASIKAGLGGVLAEDVDLPEHHRRELLIMADESADRLSRLIGNLLDMTRLQTQEMAVQRRRVLVDEVLRGALAGADADAVSVDQRGQLLLIDTDRGLAERILANVVDNAVRHQPPGQPVRVDIAALPEQDRVEVRVIDHGPGVSADVRGRMFRAFQRAGDAPAGSGLGLGLAVAAGFADAVGARIQAEDTPGGGLTMIISFPAGQAR
ncbi:two-component system sensor histidine kinase KdpD [Naumannella cuiyingiana]|uniref:histidine kinase n=1 Tax=Naumannella cuiyingiana TaxID=1347891 RepID=A0A7Z0IKS9_9ACTN|nr:two-component system sensor histidine kinase KdpD [Naumannella cuiyingiana]